jgi:hypothetical protein
MAATKQEKAFCVLDYAQCELQLFNAFFADFWEGSSNQEVHLRLAS